MAEVSVVELPIRGIDCAECASDLESALGQVEGVRSARVLLAGEKAILETDAPLDMGAIEQVIRTEGCWISEKQAPPTDDLSAQEGMGRSSLRLLALVVAAIVLVTVAGEILGGFERLERVTPWPLGWLLVAAGGFNVFRGALVDAFRRRITSRTLMSLGALAATVAGQWPVGLVVVAFMRTSDYVERFTSERSRAALKGLVRMAPRFAWVESEGGERQVEVSALRPGDIVVVRPGGRIPADGLVVGGSATVDQSSITGEPLPLDVGPGHRVFAATIATGGALRVRVERVGPDSTFGRVLRLVEEAEGHRAPVQRIADRVAAWYLPVVVLIAAATFAISRNVSATVAVMVVACSCSFALATPVAILASIGTAARRGLLIKGGRHLEALARADAVLIDKTGTLTLGRPRVTQLVTLDGFGQDELLSVAAAAERWSEHPLAEAVRAAARERGLPVTQPERFESLAGFGVLAQVDGEEVVVGRPDAATLAAVSVAAAQGAAILQVTRGHRVLGVIAAADTLRPEIAGAITELRALGLRHIELLTGDTEQAARAVAEPLGIAFRARLLPEDKIEAVRELQRRGRTVVMIGDGVNDAPALAQADVGIAMGAAGTDVALDAAHIALMGDDWMSVPEALRIARRTMGVVRLNLAFTIVYNLIGLSLAATGILPPAIAAAAQSLPDFMIVGNSARLLRSVSG